MNQTDENDEKRKLHFHITDATRIKPIYRDFDARYFNSILKLIRNNVEQYSDDLYASKLLNDNFKDFIHTYLLKNDDSALQFSELYSVVNIDNLPLKTKSTGVNPYFLQKSHISS